MGNREKYFYERKKKRSEGEKEREEERKRGEEESWEESGPCLYGRSNHPLSLSLFLSLWNTREKFDPVKPSQPLLPRGRRNFGVRNIEEERERERESSRKKIEKERDEWMRKDREGNSLNVYS